MQNTKKKKKGIILTKQMVNFCKLINLLFKKSSHVATFRKAKEVTPWQPLLFFFM
jgi:hypothetical protein